MDTTPFPHADSVKLLSDALDKANQEAARWRYSADLERRRGEPGYGSSQAINYYLDAADKQDALAASYRASLVLLTQAGLPQ